MRRPADWGRPLRPSRPAEAGLPEGCAPPPSPAAGRAELLALERARGSASAATVSASSPSATAAAPPPAPVDVRSDLAQCPSGALLDGEEEDVLVDSGHRPIPPLSCANEGAVLAALARHAAEQLRRYPRSRAADEAELAAGAAAPFSNRRNALLLLSGEKAVCEFYVGLARALGPLLASPNAREAAEAAEALCAAGGALDRDAARYCRGAVLPLLRRRAGVTPGLAEA